MTRIFRNELKIKEGKLKSKKISETLSIHSDRIEKVSLSRTEMKLLGLTIKAMCKQDENDLRMKR